MLSSDEDQDLAITKEELGMVLGGHWLGSTSVPFFSMLSPGQVFKPEKQEAIAAGAQSFGRRVTLVSG